MKTLRIYIQVCGILYMTKCRRCGWFFKDLEDWYNHQQDHLKEKPKQRYKAPYRRRYRENGRKHGDKR